MTVTAIAAVVIFVASVIQRLTGMGFALVATPVLVLLYGAREGVLLEVALGIVVSAAMLITRQLVIDWRPTVKLLAVAILFSPIGFALAAFLPEAWLMVLVALAAAFSLVSGMRARSAASGNHTLALIAAGAGSGILHVTSGLSGPPLVGYGLKTRWDHTRFVFSIQIVFIGLHLLTLGVRGLPTLTPLELAVLFAATVAGVLVARFVWRFMTARSVKRLMLTIAWIGTATVLARGVIELVRAAWG